MQARSFPVFAAALVVAFAMLACAGLSAPTQTPSSPPVTNTSLPAPTETARPTFTPLPSATPDFAATKEVSDAQAKIQSYVDAGYLSSTDGKLFALDDYSREMAKINYLDYDLTGYNDLVQDFAVWADFKMQSARPVGYPEYSGCGFSFRIDPNNYDGYTAHITNSSVLLTYCSHVTHKCGRIGKTRGTGTLNLPNPAEASMELIVHDTQANVLVNGQFIGEYTLFTDKLTAPGYLLYSIISGTNADYGTRCEATNGHLWVAK